MQKCIVKQVRAARMADKISPGRHQYLGDSGDGQTNKQTDKQKDIALAAIFCTCAAGA